jgi:hypothetical protein
MPPPLWHLPIAIVLYYLYANIGIFPVQVMPGHLNAPPTSGGGRAGARGRRSSLETRISPENAPNHPFRH